MLLHAKPHGPGAATGLPESRFAGVRLGMRPRQAATGRGGAPRPVRTNPQTARRQMKVVKGPRSTTAFVEFSDVASAMLVHQTLQGAVLQSSERGGIRIQ